ncbi:CHAP domain-containing protein, partial [Actinoplanes nipponensis]
MRKLRLRRVLIAAAATAGMTLGATLAPVAALAAPTGAGIVAIAQRELNDTYRNHEVGTNCSYYGGEMFGWPACGGRPGWGGGTSSYAWCAAFAKYVWREGGVTSAMSQIDGFARSFRTYGQNNGTWHSRSGGYGPKPGDAVVFDWNHDGVIQHVGIVKSLSDGNLYTIEGNTSDRVAKHRYSNFTANSSIVGFTTPVGITTPQPEPEPEPEPWIEDVTGDGFHDMVGVKADGSMLLYANNIVRDDGTPYSAARTVGSGWQNFTKIIPADATGDGFRDLLGVKADGTMWLYSNNFIRDGGDPYTDVRQIGSGWQNFTRIIPTDA